MRFGDDHQPVADRGQFLTLLSPDQVALQIRSGLLTQIGAPWNTAAADGYHHAA
jgi:hypothetical protein